MLRKGGSILVVDGSEVSRTIVARILRHEMEGSRVVTCATGAEALQQLEMSRFDLLTTALMLPDMDGLDLCRRIRADHTHRYMPVIVVSGDADTRLLREGFAAGVTDYFDKSLGYQAFVEFVKAFMRRNAGLVGRVLYVEDSPTAATVLRQIMERQGLQVVHVPTGEQALELLEQTRPGGPKAADGFDVVVTDFYLQGRMTGGDLLHAIRARLHYSQQEMPVLVITANDSEERQAEVFHAGANDFVTKPIVEEVLMARIRSLLLIKQQFNALKHQAEELRRLATTDSLTGVRSKRYLLDHGEAFLAERSNHPVWAMLIDIDHFKQINDSLGHLTGDHVLAALGQLLNELFEPESLVVRFGGEEFAVVMPRCEAAAAQARAEVLRRKVEQLRPVNIPVTVSIGMASTLDQPDISLNRLLALADKALYAAKARGRNRICIYSPEGAEVAALPRRA